MAREGKRVRAFHPRTTLEDSMTPEKVRQDRLRRMAERQGLVLHKSRRRDPRAYDYGAYWLMDAATNAIVFGEPSVRSVITDLDQIERYLEGDR